MLLSTFDGRRLMKGHSSRRKNNFKLLCLITMFQRKFPFPSIEQMTRIIVLKKTVYGVLKFKSTEWLTFRDILIQSIYSYIDRNTYAMYAFYLFYLFNSLCLIVYIWSFSQSCHRVFHQIRQIGMYFKVVLWLFL